MKHLLDTDDSTLLEQTHMDTNSYPALPDLPQKTRKRRTADATPMANVLLGWIKTHLNDKDFVAKITEPSQIFTHGKVLCALIHRFVLIVFIGNVTNMMFLLKKCIFFHHINYLDTDLI
jgi:F-actin monooxygenase